MENRQNLESRRLDGRILDFLAVHGPQLPKFSLILRSLQLFGYSIEFATS